MANFPRLSADPLTQFLIVEAVELREQALDAVARLEADEQSEREAKMSDAMQRARDLLKESQG